MSVNLKSLLSGWDRTFLDLSSKMAEPFCAAWHAFAFRLVAPLDPQKFENYTSLTNEVVARALIGLGGTLGSVLAYSAPAPVGCSIVMLGVGSRLSRAVGFALQKGGYTHVRGVALEKWLDPRNPQVKVMSWNICGIGGGLSLDHGGVVHWRFRLSRIVAIIKAKDPDVLVLQEVYDTALAEALVDRLKSDYAHFFMHLGPNVWGGVGGGMVISKCAVHHFSHTSFTNNRWTLNRGFACLELKATPEEVLPCARVIGTHFIHGSEPEDQKNRIEQLAQIVGHVKHRTFAVPTVLAGDLNMERDEKEGKILSSCLHHLYRGFWPTCTNRLTAQWDSKARSVWGETIDYISLFKSSLPEGVQLPVIDKEVILEECHLVEAFDASYNTKRALSDHHGLAVVIKGLHQ
jgi:endonuclease/exonuclease/phosphatase family metal-dependent hydrolase